MPSTEVAKCSEPTAKACIYWRRGMCDGHSVGCNNEKKETVSDGTTANN